MSTQTDVQMFKAVSFILATHGNNSNAVIWRLDKQIAVQPHKEITLINKEKLTTDMNVNMDKLKYHTMWKKKQHKRSHTDDYIYIKFYKSQNDRNDQ